MAKQILILILSVFTLNAVGQTPKISGKVNISIQDGIIEADLTYQNIPVSNFTFLLNTGLNISYIKDSIGNVLAFDKNYEKSFIESFEYKLFAKDNNNPSGYVPYNSVFSIKYSGKFPVLSNYDDLLELGDWKGNIAFNGSSLRASEQSTWYPFF